jgi:hypothetical protein
MGLLLHLVGPLGISQFEIVVQLSAWQRATAEIVHFQSLPLGTRSGIALIFLSLDADKATTARRALLSRPIPHEIVAVVDSAVR